MLRSEEISKQLLQKLEENTQDYSANQKDIAEISYLKRLINRVPELERTGHEVDWLMLKLDQLVTHLPSKSSGDLKDFKWTPYLMELDQLEGSVKEKFGLIKKGQMRSSYMTVGMGAGMPMCLPLGLALFDNIALGLVMGVPLGMLTGIAVGHYKENKARKKGNLL
jgi:hypothetical protein